MINLPFKKIAALLVLFALVLTASVYGQSETEEKQTETEKVHQELLKYEKTYTLQEQEEEQSFASTATGIDRKTPEATFLTTLTPQVDLSTLEKIGEEQPPKYEENLNGSIGSSGDTEFYTSNEDEGWGSGSFGVSVGGACGPGSGVRF